MIKKRLGVGVFVLIFFVGGLTAAAPVKEIEVTCPLDGTKFKTPANMAGPRMGAQLDLKPLGYMDVPPRIPVCPSNHFVVYKKDFTDDEKVRLKKFVLSPEYQEMAKDNPSYFLLAKILEYMGDTDFIVANAYLQASWQVDDRPDKEKQYIDLTLQHLKKFLSTSKTKEGPEWVTAQMLAGEAERRLGRFDEAKARFLEMSKMPVFQLSFNAKIVAYQLDLISKKDSQPHDIP
ncbi:MAG TPA: hypothetical protein VMN77_02470 [Nitrospiria bacterium]|jgi:uncharacterized protein (DUF2225 family)|nr:hypothetical protein [Nitrospiria bacterium]